MVVEVKGMGVKVVGRDGRVKGWLLSGGGQGVGVVGSRGGGPGWGLGIKGRVVDLLPHHLTPLLIHPYYPHPHPLPLDPTTLDGLLLIQK